jgi:hypothetical protein
MAVGGGPDGPLAERWNGVVWTLQSLPGGVGGGLGEISCSASTACTAIGAITTGLGSGSHTKSVPLVERWDGRSWSIEKIAVPANTRVGLSGISCPSRRFCVAVGSALRRRQNAAVVERWNGSRWSLQSTHTRRLRAPRLAGVSCTSVKACTAVGSSFGTSLVERWNGSRWTPLRGLPQVFLSAVSCSSAKDCAAVGSGGHGPVSERLHGSKQTIRPMSDPGGEPDSAAFQGIACTSATACVAVGSFYPDSSGATAPVLERLNGRRWSIVAVGAAQARGRLGGVSCPASRTCTAVGSLSTPSTSFTWALHWSGRSWLKQNTPNPTAPASAQLSAVSCVSLTACTAVGQYTDAAGQHQTLAVAWNGTEWSIQNAPNPTGASDSQLNGVSCSSVSACIAVGSSDYRPLAERWDGVRWTIQSITNVPLAASLGGISCSSESACIAVGSGDNQPLAERWDGVSWTVQNVPPIPTSGTNQLRAVACASATVCTAVGTYTNLPPAPVMNHPLVESWDGNGWSIQTAPSPNGDGYLTGASCTTASACTAVGSAFASIVTTLAESWNGINWSLLSIPSPASGGSLSGVSCTSSSDCTAVGFSTSSPSGSVVPLVEVWDGTTWAAQTPPNPAGVRTTLLNGVSCASPTVCTAVGSAAASGTTPVLIAVRSA